MYPKYADGFYEPFIITYGLLDKRYAKFYKVVDQITDELQAMVWPDTGKVRRRSKGEELVKLKLSVGKLIRDSLSIRHSKKRYPFASIRLRSSWYSTSRHSGSLTYRIHVEREYDGMCLSLLINPKQPEGLSSRFF